MESIPVLTIEDVANIDAVLQDYLTKSESDLAVIIDKGGNVISQCSFAATKELARRIGEVEFNALYHQGNGSHIFMNSVDDDTIMITVFGKETTVGLVRFYSTGASQNLAALLRGLRDRPNESTFHFDAADIAASAMSERR